MQQLASSAYCPLCGSNNARLPELSAENYDFAKRIGTRALNNILARCRIALESDSITKDPEAMSKLLAEELQSPLSAELQRGLNPIVEQTKQILQTLNNLAINSQLSNKNLEGITDAFARPLKELITNVGELSAQLARLQLSPVAKGALGETQAIEEFRQTYPDDRFYDHREDVLAEPVKSEPVLIQVKKRFSNGKPMKIDEDWLDQAAENATSRGYGYALLVVDLREQLAKRKHGLIEFRKGIIVGAAARESGDHFKVYEALKALSYTLSLRRLAKGLSMDELMKRMQSVLEDAGDYRSVAAKLKKESEILNELNVKHFEDGLKGLIVWIQSMSGATDNTNSGAARI